MTHQDSTLYAICELPKRVPDRMLREALEFEFNLPFEGDLRLGMGEDAVRAFSIYTNRKL